MQEHGQVAEFFDKRCEEFGSRGWKAAHWADSQMQYDNYDFVVRSTMLIPKEQDTVLDVGCGQGDFFRFLTECQNTPYYHGIDISTKMIENAKKKYGIHTINEEGILPYPAKAKFEVADIFEKEFAQKFDWVFAIGAFNYKFQDDQHDYVQKAVQKMYKLANKGIVVTLLKTLRDDLAGKYPYLYSYSAPKVLEHCLQLSNYITLNHGHLSSEFAIIMYRPEYVAIEMTV